MATIKKCDRCGHTWDQADETANNTVEECRIQFPSFANDFDGADIDGVIGLDLCIECQADVLVTGVRHKPLVERAAVSTFDPELGVLPIESFVNVAPQQSEAGQ